MPVCESRTRFPLEDATWSISPSSLPQVNFRVGRGWGFQPQRLKNCGWKPQSQDFSQPENQAALDY